MRLRVFAALALAVAVGLASAASPYASSAPDGLERVAQDQGFADEGRLAGLQEAASPAPDYAFPGVEDPRLATGLAGFTGTLGVFLLALGLAHVVRRGAPAAPRAG